MTVSKTRSDSLKKYYSSSKVKKQRSEAQKKVWSNNESRRSKTRELALLQGKDPAILAKRKAGFKALPIEKCSVCGMEARKHAMTRHKSKCGSVCAVKGCKELHHMKGWCLHHFKLSQYAKHYGITPDEMFTLFKKSKGKCQICKKSLGLHGTKQRNSKNTACIDHCHATGKIRGILCFRCNSGLGHFADNPKTLKIAADYLLGVQ